MMFATMRIGYILYNLHRKIILKHTALSTVASNGTPRPNGGLKILHTVLSIRKLITMIRNYQNSTKHRRQDA